MADCKIVNDSVKTAINNIGGSQQGALEGIAKSYKEAGDTFIEALKTAIAEMEGETKDALQKFFTTDVQQFVTQDLDLCQYLGHKKLNFFKLPEPHLQPVVVSCN